MIIRQLFEHQSSTYTYLVACPDTKDACLIDPVLQTAERDLKLIDELGLTLKYVFETHVHADHITGAGYLRDKRGAKSASSLKGAACLDLKLSHNEEIHVGNLVFKVLATPGHTDDSLCFYAPQEKCIFTGDTMLIRGNGRTDFQNGSAHDLYQSLTIILHQLPEETVVYPGHDYKGLTTSTIGEEKRWNTRIYQKTEAEFVDIMNSLHLDKPKQIDIAVPANRGCGTVNMAAP